MCGIAGYMGKFPPDEMQVGQTLQLMKNRGPDCQRIISFNDADNRILMLHSRLSIIDLDERSHQPFTIGNFTIVFNGEIYNYLELRSDLQQRGINFITSSDTEVLLRSYIFYGERCVDRFEGMWSFAIFDAFQGTLFFSRDRFAEKPLYYYQALDGIYFGSEIKFISALAGQRFTINRQHILRYLVNGYKALYKVPETYFNEIKELPYATNMTVGRDLSKVVSRYWQPTFSPQKMGLAEAIEGSRYHLMESIRIRLRADVPLAFCLSGGIDSSALVSIAAKQFGCNVATFSIIDHDERYNEYENIKATVDDLGCENSIIEISPDGTLERLASLIAYHDAPVATITYYVHSFLSEAISQRGYRVVFSGTSADELFTGYYDHFNLHLYEIRNHPDYKDALNDWMQYIQPIVRNPYLQKPDLYFADQTIRNHIYLNNDEFALYLKKDFREDFTEETYCVSLLRNRMLNELLHESTPLILHEDDLNSMMYSLENRSPYLDSRLFAFAYSIPPEYLIRDGYGKYVLREAVKGILNDKVRLDRQKKGFNASINSIIDFNASETREFLLDDGPIFELVDRDKIAMAMSMSTMPNSYSKFLFNFVNAKLFMEQNA